MARGWERSTSKKGPRDIDVSWATVCFFFFISFTYYYLFLGIYWNYYSDYPRLCTHHDDTTMTTTTTCGWEGSMNKKGPRDVSTVCFFFLVYLLLAPFFRLKLLTTLYSTWWHDNDNDAGWTRGYDEGKKLKWCHRCFLGCGVFFFLFSYYWNLYI